MNTVKMLKKLSFPSETFLPKSRNHLDLAVKSNPTMKKNILLKFYEYCKNVERSVISIRDISPQKP